MKKSKKVGMSPGSLVFTGEKKLDEHIIKYIRYNAEQYDELAGAEVFKGAKDKSYNHWIDVKGIHDADFIAELGETFSIHKLILEDILDPSQRTKIEDYGGGIFVSLKNFEYHATTRKYSSEQISFFFNQNFLLSFQENPDDTFAGIRTRMQAGQSRIRARKPDYLLYALMDFVVDRYFLVLDQIELEVSSIEVKVDHQNSMDSSTEIYEIRNQLLDIRKAIAPLRDELQQLRKMDNELIDPSTLFYLRDLEDHAARIIEVLDNQREMLYSVKDLIMQRANLDMNRDMKWLAVVSTMAIPIVFFTGVYGMNFDYMPELSWKYSYLVWWIGIITVLVLLAGYFKRKNLL